jgi:hypothetical protein
MTSEVTDLLATLRAGRMSLDEVAQRFRNRAWPRGAARAPSTYLEFAARAQEDPEADVPGSFDEVTSPLPRRNIGRRLRSACPGNGRFQGRGRPAERRIWVRVITQLAVASVPVILRDHGPGSRSAVVSCTDETDGSRRTDGAGLSRLPGWFGVERFRCWHWRRLRGGLRKTDHDHAG